MSSRCEVIALVVVLFAPFQSQVGWCSLILSDKRLVVRPRYDVPQEHLNEYTRKLVVSVGSFSFSRERISGEERNERWTPAAK